jgi:hypothetical protein
MKTDEPGCQYHSRYEKIDYYVEDNLCSQTTRLMIISFGVGGSSGVVNRACRCSAGGGGHTSERCHHCWYESLQLQAFLLVVVV